MADKSPNKRSHLVLVHRQKDQAVMCMTEMEVVEILIAGKKGGAPLLEQEGNEFLVLHSETTGVETDLKDVNTPALKELALIGRNILVKDDHADIGFSVNSSACRSRACPASWIASRMASLVTFPFAT
jgi:hypothetical protein